MPRHLALVPAAGAGSRMGAATAKQYLELRGRPLIWHTLATLCAHPGIDRVFVVLAVDDAQWGRHDWSAFDDKLVPLFCGGASRAESVRNGLRSLHAQPWAARDDDWVLVHDAARACLAHHQLDCLMRELAHDDVGGLLAVRVADTLKRADAHSRSVATVPRDNLWQAQTPQMFRYAVLRRALERHHDVTDEASAVEAAGLQPRLVAADMTNLKVTYPLDLHLAELILRDRENAP